MLIEHIEIQRKRGVGLIVLLALLLFSSLPALVLSVLRLRNVRLDNVPQVRLFGKIPLGSSLAWGLLIFSLGFLICLVGFTNQSGDSFELWLLWLVFVPFALTGLLLALYWGFYRIHRAAAEVLLEQISVKDVLTEERMQFVVQGTQYTSERAVGVLEDLRAVGAVAFDELGDGRYRAWITSPELLAHLGTVEGARERRVKKVAWTCPACGAPNNTAADGVCEYCGGGRK